jgi:hypothetical protein
MRVMVIVKATKNSASGAVPSERLLNEMGKPRLSLGNTAG